ncbi:MAG: undecaprenyldiphospho-muramoylpentapeptide beta-N-acetylglucosaminyltransferase [Chitinivibrionales bacterium]|nr:undecaprenyldiphospho-muramoylpentapeptide beta-N-acetylglucosaminyltransferase [Chitinivibrionales bacterium]
MNILLTAGGTGGHIFPALSVALAFRKKAPDTALHWIGTRRNREQELCARYAIPLSLLAVSGFKRSLSLQTLKAAAQSVGAVQKARGIIRNFAPDAVLAFGGYVCAPVLAAAQLSGIPCFIQEQNTVPGMVNRFFGKRARMSFLGLPLHDEKALGVRTMLTGNPVREITGDYADYAYPETIDREKPSILICGGSQGALSMNRSLIKAVGQWCSEGLQVIWQTGRAGCEEVRAAMSLHANCAVFASLDDLYPYYAQVKLVIGRAGASTLSEVAYFGLPFIPIPLPWSAENHQWKNAGLVEAQGWGIRIRQDEHTGMHVDAVLRQILYDKQTHEQMSKKALDNSPVNAADTIVVKVKELLKA